MTGCVVASEPPLRRGTSSGARAAASRVPPFVRKKTLQRLWGLFAWAFLFRRECFSVFHYIYTFLESSPLGEVVRLPGAAVDEIGAAALHLPFAVTDLRRPLAGELLAMDDTPSAAGACTSPIAAPMERALLRRSEVKGGARPPQCPCVGGFFGPPYPS